MQIADRFIAAGHCLTQTVALTPHYMSHFNSSIAPPRGKRIFSLSLLVFSCFIMHIDNVIQNNEVQVFSCRTVGQLAHMQKGFIPALNGCRILHSF